MIIDTLVGFHYPYSELIDMPFSELKEWLEVATENRRVNDISGA